MTIILSHDSALEHLRSLAFASDGAVTSVRPERDHAMSSAEAIDIGDQRLGLHSLPYHVLVGSGRARGRQARIVNHVCSQRLPKGSFRSIKRGFSVACPELCFIQMAETLSPVKLIELGFELCGSYSIDENDMRGFTGRGALMSTASLQRYLQKASGIKGTQAAKRALPHIIDGSASPMETKLAMLLSLPASYGGFGLPKPRLNHPVITKDESAYDGKRHYLCDLYWPDSKLAIEYDSDMFHTGSDRISHDAERRRNLIAKGITVISVTKDQVLYASKTEALARMLASKMKRRVRTSIEDAADRRIALRKELFR